MLFRILQHHLFLLEGFKASLADVSCFLAEATVRAGGEEPGAALALAARLNQADLDQADASVMCIGPAGENLVKFTSGSREFQRVELQEIIVEMESTKAVMEAAEVAAGVAVHLNPPRAEK